MRNKKFLVGLAALCFFCLGAATVQSSSWFSEPRAMYFTDVVKFKQPATFDSTSTFTGNQTFNGEATFNDDVTATMGAAENVKVDGSTTAHTETDGLVDIDLGTVTANANALNISATQNNGTTAATDSFAAVITLTQNDADGDLFGIKMTAAATANAAANSYEYGYFFDCAENTAGACLDGILITSSGANTGLTDGLDVSAANITNGINLGANILAMTDGDFDATGKFSLDAADDITLTLTAASAGEDFIVDQNGNVDSSILISTEGSGADALKLETLTNGGDMILSSVDNIQIISTTASGLIDIDGTAGLVYSIAEDDTAADDIDLGSAKDDVDIEGEDITLDTADDANFTVADDLVFTMESAGGIWNANNTAGGLFKLGDDDTTADTITVGSAKDDLDVAGEDINLTSADDMHFLLGSAAGILNVLTGTQGYVFNLATNNTAADDINIGSALDDIDMDAENVDILSADDAVIAATDDISINGGSAGSILNFGTNAHGNVINVGTDNSLKDTINIGSALDDIIAGGTPGAEAGAGVAAAERCIGAICQTVFTFTNASITLTDPGGAAAYGGLKIYDFPAGYLLALGAVADLTLTEASATIDAAFDGDISLGTTVGEATATLHNPVTEDNWVPTVATTQAVASVAAADFQSTVTEQVYHDGHSTAIDIYLNVEIDDADITTGGADAVVANGTLTITWINLGDNG